MRKFTKVETSIITTALGLWKTQFQAEVKAVEDSGNNPIFSQKYPEMMEKEINEKLVSLTIKTKR